MSDVAAGWKTGDLGLAEREAGAQGAEGDADGDRAFAPLLPLVGEVLLPLGAVVHDVALDAVIGKAHQGDAPQSCADVPEAHGRTGALAHGHGRLGD